VALSEALCTCPNFKVCTNASLALGSLSSYTPVQVRQVLSAIFTSLERSLQHQEFPQFKQAANLQVQLCRSLCHVLCVQTDLANVPPHPLSDAAVACLSKCFSSMQASPEDRAVLEAAERRLSSHPVAVGSSPSLSRISLTLATSLS
jgi:hypothetical protein